MKGNVRRATVALLAALVSTALLLPGSVAAAGPTLVTVVDGLHSPRGLAFGAGDILYAAQAGDAASAGSIIEIRNAMSQHPSPQILLGDIPTIGDEGEFIGVDGISVLGRGSNQSIYAIMGLSPQATGSDAFGALMKVSRTGSATTVANVGSSDFDWAAAHSSLWEEFPDANPYDVLALPGHTYVIDAGANTLDEVLPDGSVEVLAFFPNELIRDAVPTCVAQGPDGALYVGTLALVDSIVLGPMAKVYRVDPAQANLADPTATPMSVWASGLFPINGCAFGPDGSFYASQMFTNPAHDEGAIFGDPRGDVVRIPWGDPAQHISLTGGALSFAGGVAVAPNGAVFVADGTFGGPGSIVRIGR